VRAKLTKKLVEAVAPADHDILVWDTELRGLACKVTPKRSRVYLLYYRTLDGRERRPKIGVHGAITCDQARAVARRWLGEVAAGNDPSEEKQSRRKSATVRDLCQQFIDEHCKRRLKATTFKTYSSIIANHIIPLIGDLKIDRVRQADIERLMRAVEDGDTRKVVKLGKQRVSKVRGGKGVANRNLTVLSKMFNFAESRELRARGSNPVRHVQHNPENPRERFLTNREFGNLAATLNQLEREGLEDARVINIIRFYLFTGMRRTEGLTLKWDHVDLDERVLKLPDSKTGRKIVYLGTAAAEFLAKLPRLKDNPYVFYGDEPGGHFVAINKAWYRIRKAAGLHDVTLHDLRRSWGSVAARGGMSLLLIGKAMGHKTTKATEVYARISDDARRDAVEAITARVAELAG
jgi:integrase